MNLKTFKRGSILMTSVLSLFLVSSSAFANTASDPYATPKINGEKYTFTSEIWERFPSTGKTVEAVATVKANGVNVPVGYMGSMARLFNNSGNLEVASKMTYNPVKVSSFYVYSNAVSKVGTYYSHSIGEFYNGNGYDRFTGYQSPKLQITSAKSINAFFGNEIESSVVIEALKLKSEYDVNNNGDTYGSALSEQTIGVEPDLIAAVGTNGLNGYVKAVDLTPEVNSIEEGLEQMQSNNATRTIPLYDVEGITVIGQFDLVTKYELIE